MANKDDDIRYLVFDVESVADGRLVSKIRFPGENLEAGEAIERYRAELMAKYDSDFIPYTFQLPISIVVGKVNEAYELKDLVALDQPEYRPHQITKKFWRGWELYKQPTLVSFNGRSFDIPLMEIAAFRYGLSIPAWFQQKGPNYTHPRYRYNVQHHLDLCDLLTNYGASRMSGGLNLAASVLGRPGKIDVQGDMVQDLFDEGKLAEINDYCRCDVLDTYFVFLRTAVLQGNLELNREQELVAQTKDWLTERVEEMPVYQTYLDHWGDWENPWLAE